MYTQETYEYKGFFIDIVPDEDPFNPREDCENLGTMVCWHHDLVLGDDLPSRFDERFKTWDKDRSKAFFERWIKINQQHLVTLPLYIYHSSQVVISTTPFCCLISSWQIGWIYAHRFFLKEHFRVDNLTAELIETTKKILTREVNEYNDYVMGNMWRYVIKNRDREVIETRAGYKGEDVPGECLADAKNLLMESRSLTTNL